MPQDGRPTVPTRAFLTIYVAWHPKFERGAGLARLLYDHYRRNLYENVAGGTGIPEARDRIDAIVCRLMDEVLKDFLWRCWIQLVAVAAGPQAIFLPRPPELIALTCLKGKTPPINVLVYPDPPIGAEEMTLFDAVASSVKLLSATEFLGGAGA